MTTPGTETREADRRTGDHVEIAGDYQHRALHQGPAPQRFWHWAKIEEAITSLELAPGNRVLDVGCGSGVASARAAETPGVDVLGVDGNPAAIEFARQTFARSNLQFRLGLVDELDLPAASFDKVIFLEVIEHLTQRQGAEVLAAFRRLLRPGGRVVLSTPNRRSLWPVLEWLLDRLRLVPNLGDEQHEHLYTVRELRQIAGQAGFRVIETKMVNTLAPWLAWLSATLARRVHAYEVRWLRSGGSLIVMTLEPADVLPGISARR